LKRLAPLVSRYGAIVLQFAVVASIARSLSLRDAGVYISLNGVVTVTFVAAGFGIPDGLVRTVSVLRGSEKQTEALNLLRRGLAWAVLSLIPTAVVVGAVVGLTRNPITGLWMMLWWALYGLSFLIAQGLVALGRGVLGTFVFYTLINVGVAVVVIPAAALGWVHSVSAAMAFTVIGAAVSLLGFAPFVPRAALSSRSTAARWVPRLPSRLSSPLPVNIANIDTTGVVVRKITQPKAQTTLGETRRVGLAIAANRVVQAAAIWSPVWISAVVVHVHGWSAIVGVGSRLAAAVGAALAAISFSIRPRIVSFAAKGDATGLETALRRVSIFTVGLVLVAAVGALTIGRPLIELSFGRRYGDAAWVLTIMLIGAAADGFAGASAEVVKMVGSASRLLVVQIGVFGLGAVAQVVIGTLAGQWWQLAAYAASVVVYDLYVRAAAVSEVKKLATRELVE
jgi:O-antigen/teichoic acid export membrane protein